MFYNPDSSEVCEMTAEKIDWDWPKKREEDDFEGAKVKLERAKTSVWFANEATVAFVINGKKHIGWMPDYSVNLEEKWLKAFIIGDYKNGDWHIMIPDETMSSTEFLRVPKSEQGTVVQKGWW